MVQLARYEHGEPREGRALLVHGLSSSAAGWWRVVEHLNDRGWAVTTVDLRGHGDSPAGAGHLIPEYAADLLEIWPEERGGIPWDVVVGHSLGGSTSLVAAGAEPGWTRVLALVDPVLEIDGPGLDRIRDGIVEDKRNPSFADLRAKHPGWHDRDIEAKAAALESIETTTVEATLAEPGAWQLAAPARAIAVPTLLLSADPDAGGLLHPSLGRAIAADNPLVTAATAEGAGHSIHRDDPESLFLFLDRFLAQAASA